ncbi:MAG: hypothetical protein CL846_09170 [Crocinitomicaceae bacterium]|nr:hypothetical protein [Crocinitomicaceae bacterium]|tara:strand:+ start:764 stop:1663 length:900 start_codon:yes stop_codon:yes gene_type:complete
MKNNLKKLSELSVRVLAISFICIQCTSSSSSNKNEKDITQVSDSESSHSIEIELDTTESDYAFIAPSPIQIASIIQKAEMSYVDGITNEIENVNNYTTLFHQSINFGVYASDIAYCVTNDKYDEAGNYMKVIKDLSKKIGLETVFQSSNLIDRFEENIGNQDSIMDLLIYIQTHTDDYIQDNGLNDLNVIYFTGAWIEGMFLGTHAVVGDADKKISILLSEQMTIANSLIRGLEHIKDKNDDITDLTEHIKNVVSEYNNLWSNKQAGENIEYLDTELKHEEVVKISSMITELRNEITLK